MSGHSHFSSIKHKKALEDQKRGKIFSKLARIIALASKDGADPEKNSKLRRALEEAKSFNMPKENISRAIKRGTGEIEGKDFEEVIYEAFGPGGVSIIIEGITDNKNRTLAEIKKILQKYGGKLTQSGAIKWKFDRKGVITITPLADNENKESLELKAIESGAEDIYWHQTENLLDVYTKPEELDTVKKNLSDQGLMIKSASLDWVAKEEVEITGRNKEIIEKLFEELDENDAVQDVYSNLKT